MQEKRITIEFNEENEIRDMEEAILEIEKLGLIKNDLYLIRELYQKPEISILSVATRFQEYLERKYNPKKGKFIVRFDNSPNQNDRFFRYIVKRILN